ncbi:MAG: ABC transporter permease [Phycisphaeraceae bacterium]|nr:MAG: ABC transporter permease [Phycisphaeraceae bacterium]
MNKVLIVAWRDFKSTALTLAFFLAVLGVPVLVVAVGAVAGVILATHKPPPLVGKVLVIDPTGELVKAATLEFDPRSIDRDAAEQVKEAAQGLEQIMGEGNLASGVNANPMQRGEIRVEVAAAPDGATPESLSAMVRGGEILAAAIIPPQALDIPVNGSSATFDLFVAEGLEGTHTSLIEERLGRAAVRVRAERAGMDLARTRAVLERPRAATNRLLASGEVAQETEKLREIRRFIIPMAFMMLLWISVFSTGQHLLNSTIEEKSNKVMEVLLSAVSPLQLLAGKILGQAAVGLVILGVYSAAGVFALVMLSQSGLVPWTQLVYLGVFFFMAYFMVASMMAAVGSAVSDIREANSLLTPVMILLMFPLMLWMPISQAPNGMIATIFSFVPPATPFVMILRLCADEHVPLWQVIASIVWGYACVVGMVWLAAKIFRVGVLMSGKPPSPIELIRWARYQ